MNKWLIWALSYFVGSIPCGVIVARTQNIDIQKQGSGNIGATNVARSLSKKAGLITLLGDCLKGGLPVYLADRIFRDPTTVAITGLVAFFGHVFSVFLKFKGGKGVATGLGVFLYLMPLATLSSVIVFTLTLTATGFVSAGSILAALALPATGIWLEMPQSYIFTSVAVALMIVQKHHDNIRRLLDGTEAKFLSK